MLSHICPLMSPAFLYPDFLAFAKVFLFENQDFVIGEIPACLFFKLVDIENKEFRN